MCRAVDIVSTGQVIQYPVDTVSRGASERLVISGGDISKYLLIKYYPTPREV